MTEEWYPFQVKELRRRMGLTQSAFADLLQVSSSTVSRWETGAHPPTSRHRIALTATDRMQRSIFTSRGLPE
jgi:DNA-binding transcriptional regulator YiaG